MAEVTVSLEKLEDIPVLFGKYDENIKLIENEFGVSVVQRDNQLKLSGAEGNALLASKVLEEMNDYVATGTELSEQTVRYLIGMAKEGATVSAAELVGDCVCITAKGKPIRGKTLGQKEYIAAMEKNTVVMAIGPAGTGKTYLAVAEAVRAFRAKQISRIILTRPAVEAGEKLGFLPGDMQTKVDPYLRPLYDALFDMLGAENFSKHLERGSIEVAPLAYMRGRTLDDSFIILDEAQNTTPEQMKMFLTRLGMGSKAVITGDVTQIDLPDARKSGLIEASKVLKGVEDIAVVKLDNRDVVRHRLVQEIVKAYEKYYSLAGRRAAKK